MTRNARGMKDSRNGGLSVWFQVHDWHLLESENQPGAAGPLRCGWKGIECGDYWVNFLHYPRVTHIFGPSAFGDVERSDGYEIA